MQNKKKKEYGLLNRPLFEHVTVFGVAALVMGAVAYIGIVTSRAELNAARPPTITTAVRDADALPGTFGLTIQGSNFEPGATVKMGEQVLAEATYVSSTTLRAVMTLPLPTSDSVTVTNPDGQSGNYDGASKIAEQVTTKASALSLSVVMSHMDTEYAAADMDGDGHVGIPDMAMIQGAWTW